MNKIHIYYLHYLFRNFEIFKMSKKKLQKFNIIIVNISKNIYFINLLDIHEKC